jgi:hypothetical protein
MALSAWAQSDLVNVSLIFSCPSPTLHCKPLIPVFPARARGDYWDTAFCASLEVLSGGQEDVAKIAPERVCLG